MICLKISTFVVSKTTKLQQRLLQQTLWFAWKSVPLWYLKQLRWRWAYCYGVVICLKISTFVVSKTTQSYSLFLIFLLWFAWKSVPLWYLKQRFFSGERSKRVVICLKISTFVVSKTTRYKVTTFQCWLWFAWKSVPLWYLKQHNVKQRLFITRCDLLENQYLCGI